MPYANTNSLVASDINNCLRGLYRDNTDHAVNGTTNETNLASVSIAGSTIGATGGIVVIAAGTVTNSAGAAKTIKLYLGATAVATVSRTGANAQDWVIEAHGYNTSASAQRWAIRFTTADAVTESVDYITSAIDTSSAATLKVTGTLVDGADTITQTIFDVYVVQIT